MGQTTDRLLASMFRERRTALMRLARWAVLLSGLACMAGCDWSAALGFGVEDGDDTGPPATETDVAGLDLAIADASVDDTYARLASTISAQSPFVRRIDHAANAAGIGRPLRPTRVIVFAVSPRFGPILQADPRAGLDLPSKMLVYRDAENNVAVSYNDPDFLAARYDLEEAGDALEALGQDLRVLAQDAAGNAVSRETPADRAGAGQVEIESDNDFATTLDALSDAIAADADLTLIDRIDQQVLAARMNYTINPSVLVLFRDDDTDSAWLRTAQSAGIDLPHRILVLQDEAGAVHLYYNDPAYIAARHGIIGRDDEVQALDGLISDLAKTAATR